MLSEASAVAVFREFAMLDEGAAAIRFTPAIFELDRPALAAVLRGLFTADGTVANYGEQSQLRVASTRRRSSCSARSSSCCSSFGIKSQLYEAGAASDDGLLPDGHGGAEYPSSRSTRCGSAAPRVLALRARDRLPSRRVRRREALARLNAEVSRVPATS